MKKPHQITNRYSEITFKNIYKYIISSRRAGLATIFGPCGITSYGSKNLQLVFKKYESEFLEACIEDTKGLNDEDRRVVEDFAPVSIDQDNVMGAVLSMNEVPLLPWPLNIMNEHECVKYLLPELKKDIAENTGRTVSRIAWGSERDHPKCWADDLAPWCSVGNINHTQQTKFDVIMVDVLQETISRRIKMKGLGGVQNSQLTNESA